MDPEPESGHPANTSPLRHPPVPRGRQTVCLLALLATMAALLEGCFLTPSRTIRLAYDPKGVVSGPNVAVRVEVEDRRTFVVDGDKDPTYVGLWRSMGGVPWDVTTESAQALAGLIQHDLVRELDALGFRTDADPPARLLLVAIQQWNFDGYLSVNFWSELDVAVFDASGERLASSEVRRNAVIEGHGGGAEGSWGKQLRRLYGDILKAVVRENAEIMSALVDGPGPPQEEP